MKERLVIHFTQSLDVDAQGFGHCFHVQAKGLEELNEVHFFACEWIMKPGTAPVTLWPRAVVHKVMMTQVLVHQPTMPLVAKLLFFGCPPTPSRVNHRNYSLRHGATGGGTSLPLGSASRVVLMMSPPMLPFPLFSS